jgi:hypothetical protein
VLPGVILAGPVLIFTVMTVPCFGLLLGFVIPRTDSWYTGTSGTSKVRARGEGLCLLCLTVSIWFVSALVPETVVPFV